MPRAGVVESSSLAIKSLSFRLPRCRGGTYQGCLEEAPLLSPSWSREKQAWGWERQPRLTLSWKCCFFFFSCRKDSIGSSFPVCDLFKNGLNSAPRTSLMDASATQIPGHTAQDPSGRCFRCLYIELPESRTTANSKDPEDTGNVIKISPL